MPIHDWTRVDAGLLHDFHQSTHVLAPLKNTCQATWDLFPAALMPLLED